MGRGNKTRCTPTLKEVTPTRVMLREFKILNPGESINQRKYYQIWPRLVVGSPMHNMEGKFMECT